MKKLIACFFYLALFFNCTALAAQEVKLTVNPKVIHFGDSFNLLISSDTKLTHDIDFSPIRLDFDIVSQSHNFSTKMINGQFTQTYEWHLNLVPKRSGTLTIPPLLINGSETPPESIEVLIPSANELKESNIFLETTLEPMGSLHEQEQLIYTVRLFYATQLVQASLSEVKSNDPNMLIEKLGNDIQYEQIRNGKKFNVFERKYAVFPQVAGDLTFSPIVFDGKIVSGRASFFEVQTQHKRLESNPLQVSVQPIPAPFNRKNWLIANQVTVQEEWSKDLSQLSIDEPVTRTIVIKANGCLGSQIPHLNLEGPEAFKQYFDKPESVNQSTDQGIIGSLTLKMALIPTKAGEFTLPSLSIPWWNSSTGKIETASIPAKTLHIPESPVTLNQEMANPSLQNDLNGYKIESENTNEHPFFAPFGRRELFSISLNLILMCFLFYLIRKYPVSSRREVESIRLIRSKLRSACKRNQAKEAEVYFLDWFKWYYPHEKSHNLYTAKACLPLEFTQTLADLSKHLYGSEIHPTQWDGSSLWKIISHYKVGSDMKIENKTNPLKTLYPKDKY